MVATFLTEKVTIEKKNSFLRISEIAIGIRRLVQLIFEHSTCST
jgi:hypothetical protein